MALGGITAGGELSKNESAPGPKRSRYQLNLYFVGQLFKIRLGPRPLRFRSVSLYLKTPLSLFTLFSGHLFKTTLAHSLVSSSARRLSWASAPGSRRSDSSAHCPCWCQPSSCPVVPDLLQDLILQGNGTRVRLWYLGHSRGRTRQPAAVVSRENNTLPTTDWWSIHIHATTPFPLSFQEQSS